MRCALTALCTLLSLSLDAKCIAQRAYVNCALILLRMTAMCRQAAACACMHARTAAESAFSRRGAWQDPVDLSLIQARLQAGGYYIALDIFAADVKRMCANARVYNAAHTIYVQYANRVRAQRSTPCMQGVLRMAWALRGTIDSSRLSSCFHVPAYTAPAPVVLAKVTTASFWVLWVRHAGDAARSASLSCGPTACGCA